MVRSLACAVATMIAVAPLAASQAAVVGFTGTIVNSCVLTVATPGALGLAPSGTSMDSEQTGGVDAIMTVVSSGNTPTLSFAAPTLTGPSASTANATSQIAFSSTGGASQGFVSTVVNYLLNRLSDTFTVKGKVSNASGFVSGVYTLSTVVTCQQ